MVNELNKGEKDGQETAFLYSDEDKCDQGGSNYYEPNLKPDFNFDYLLSNNYICHFLVMKASLMKELQFRPVYDGAQDFDLILRAAVAVMLSDKDAAAHVKKVLYHWRCHKGSTAVNPRSKQYAYEAGRRAVEDNLKDYLEKLHVSVRDSEEGFYADEIPVLVSHTAHNGFYRVQYGTESVEDIFRVRPDVAGVAYPVIEKNKITSGIYNRDGDCLYDGMPVKYSGYLHRSHLQQDVYAAKSSCLCLRKEYDFLKKKNIISIRDLTNKKSSLILYDPLRVSGEKGK